MNKETAIGVGTLLLIFVVAPVGASMLEQPPTTCDAQSISYETIRTDDGGLPLGEEKTIQDGTEGSKDVCTKEGVVVSETVVSQPVNELISVGTYEEPEYVEPVGYNSVGCPLNQQVSGYYRSNGTYVAPYWRNSPNDDC